jgi:hypothetical protein
LIYCRVCEIALSDDTKRCPMCQRRLQVPYVLIVGGAVLLFALLGLLLWGSGRIKRRVERWQISNEEVRKAAESLVAKNPAVRNPVSFSSIDQTTVEHWDGPRWRVSGYVDSLPQPGVKIRTLYFAVVQNRDRQWALEDLQLQNVESGSDTVKPKN